MMNILVDVSIYTPGLEKLKSLPDVSVIVCDPVSEEALERPKSIIKNIDLLFCSEPPKNLDDMTRLKWMQIASSGFEHLIPLNLPKRGILASNARGVFDIPIAEWCISMIINLTRDLPRMYRNQQTGYWDRGERFQKEVRGKTVGFWGYGGLARETARLAKAMGMNVHVLTREGVRAQKDIYCVEGTGDPEGKLPDKEYLLGKKNDFLGSLDYLIMGLPLNEKTRGIVTADDLCKLPASAYLLNPARGPLIVEKALIQALKEDWIAGAALDTHYEYPMAADHPLWYMPNVIMTPHISGSTKSTHFVGRIWDLFFQNVVRYKMNKPLLNLINSKSLNQ